MKKFCISPDMPARENDRYWQFCVGSGHAALGLRADYQAQLKRAHDELGFQRVRFHGIFSDDMNVLQRFYECMAIPGAKTVRTQSFYQVAVLFDALLDMGIRPFVELGFMPIALASGKRTVFRWKGNVTPPADQNAWGELVRRFIRFLLDRYGRQEVESWYFEVWNEPDLPVFWSGSKEDYFTLYRTTVQAIKSVDPDLRVGGPSTSQNRWLKEMQAFCTRENLPLDFLSTHHYPGDGVGLPMISKENISRMLQEMRNCKGKSIQEAYRRVMYRPEQLPLIPRDSLCQQALTAREEAGELPLFYTEWNVNPTCTAPLHDTTQSSAFLIKHVMDCQYIMDGCSYWTFSDIFEENTFMPEPFAGSFGLMNVYGIPKPSYWAFYLLNMLGGERLALPTTHEEIELAAFRSEQGLQLLIYRQSFPEGDGSTQDVEIELPGGQTYQQAQIWKIDETHGNPIKLWKEMGSPRLLSRAQAKEIEERSKLSAEPLALEQTDGSIRLHTKLAVNDVQLIVLNR